MKTNTDSHTPPGSRAGKRVQRRAHRYVPMVLAVVALLCAAALAAVITGFYRNVCPRVRIEAGQALPSAAEFLRTPTERIVCGTDLSLLRSDVPGEYPVEFSQGPLHKTAILSIEDTVAPAGDVRDLTLAVDTPVAPEDFVTAVRDETAVTLRFAAEPDLSAEGTQQVDVLLEDLGGNRTTLTAALTLYRDDEAPVISGAKNKTVYAGESISYKSGVTVSDNLDPSPTLTIDNTAVDLDTPGTYPVTYTATDSFGNASSVSVNVHVEAVPTGYENVQELYDRADALLATLLTDDMTEIEQAFAIWRWVRLNVPWYSGRVPHNLVDQAIKGLKGQSGDCYTCTVACKTLMERAGFECVFMERNPGPGYHYWLLVKVNGNWYHMDPSPIYVRQFVCFLGTDAQLQWFTDEKRPNYYNFDHSLFPATPDEPAAEAVYKNGDYTLVIT